MKKIISVYSLLIIVCLTGLTACSSSTANVSPSNTSAAANTQPSPAGEPASAGAQSPAAAAEAVVADLYKQHDGKKSPFFQTKNRALVDKYFTKPLADLIWKDATTSAGEVGAIDADPLYSAQDVEIKNFAVGRGEIKGDTANVPVTFTNYGEKKTINFQLKQSKDIWKIDNILYGDGDSLSKWLKETYSTKPSAETAVGEFEGKFQVGDTSCTVKPVKMAFEVRWAKGSGSEVFVFIEGTTFESDAGNRFEFDDENYNSGTFYRPDGKTFPVKRAK